MKKTIRHFLLLPLIACMLDTYAKEPEKIKQDNSSIQILENKGQVTDQYGNARTDINFKIENGGVTMFGGKGKVSYQWTKENQKEKVKNKKDDYLISNTEQQASSGIEIYRLDVTLIGANPNAEVIFKEPTGYNENYYLPQCPDGATAKGYGKVIYKDVYPNIDFILYVNSKSEISDSKVKYDFVVRPGGNPADIHLRYDGATELKLIDGALMAVTPFGTITENAPYSYDALTKQKIPSTYKLNGNTLSFDVQKTTGTLVIDPTLEWATYYGGSNGEHDPKCATDNLGNIYLSGRTWSVTNIATTGAYQSSIGSTGGWQDAFIVKFDSTGTRIWATYYGGTNHEQPNGLFVDPYNNVYMAGYTQSSTSISTTGAHQTSLVTPFNISYPVDGFIVKFNSAGQRQWGTYYGGKGTDEIETIHGDSNFIYIGGHTQSDTGITTSGTHQPVYIDSTGNSNSNLPDGFVAKFNHSGARIWGTYYGGASGDGINDIAADKNGKLFIAGGTTSDTGIASIGAYDITNGTPIPFTSKSDIFLAKLNTNGIREWGTFYGGSNSDGDPKITLDAAGNIYMAAQTNSTDSIASPGSKNPVPIFNVSNAYDLFLSKFNTNGQRIWSDYITIVDAINGNEHYMDITTDINNRVYITGTAIFDSSKLDPCFNTFIPLSWSQTHNIFVIAHDSSGSIYLSKVFSGNSWAYAGSVATYKEDNFYVAGSTQSTSGIATTGAHQTTCGGNSDLCLFKFSIDTNVYLEQPFKDTLFCKGQAVPMKYIVTKQFKSGNTFSIQLSDTFGSFTSPITIGSVTATTGGTISCTIPNNILQSGNYKIRIISTNPAIIPCVQNKKIGIGIAFPDSLVSSSNSPICRQDTVKLFSSSVTAGVTYAWSGPMNFSAKTNNTTIPNIDTHGTFQYVIKAGVYGCYDYDTVTMVVKPIPVPPVGSSNSPVCSNDTLKLTANTTTTGVTYNWIGANSFTSSQQNPVLPKPPLAADGSYIVTATLNGCARGDTISVQIKPIPLNQATSSNSPLCAANDTLKLYTLSTTSGITYSWTGPNSFSSSQQNPVLAGPSTAASGNYIASVILNGCVEKDTVAVTVKPKPAITLGSNSPVCLGHSVNLTASNVTGGSYNWWGPASFTSSLQNPTISSITSPMAGIYKAVATLNGCKSDTESVTVSIAASTPKPSGSSNSPVCTGQDIQLSASTITGATYQWWGPASFSTTLQNPTRNNALTTHGGQYYITAAINGCISDTDTVVVVVDLAPQVNIAPLSGTDICKGKEATFIAAGNNAGTSPQYNWLINGIATGNTTTTFKTSALNNGDIVSCAMNCPGTCGSSYADTSNTIGMTVKAVLAPAVSITANPAHQLFPNEHVTFTAAPINGGSIPLYQWKRNGQNIAGATGNNWGVNANALQDGDKICVWMKSSYVCPSQDTVLSNCITVQIKVGIAGVDGNNKVFIYPNPVHDVLHITLPASLKGGDSYLVELFDIVGRKVYRATSTGSSHTINTANLQHGNYLLKLTDKDGNRIINKVVKE